MITRIVVIFYCLAIGIIPVKAQLPPIGSWRDHLPYHQAIAVQAAGNKLWCATPYSLFSVDPTDKTIERLSRTNGLTETGISAICYDQETGKLLIAYTSSNIDIRTGENIVNVPDVRRSGLALNNAIRRIDVYGGLAYLSTTLGIIVLDEAKAEVRDTYIIGSNGDTAAVNAFAASDTYLYAATAEGVKRVSATSPDPADYHNWELIDPGACDQVLIFGGSVLTVRRDTVFRVNGGSFFANGWSIKDCSVVGDKLLISQQRSDSGLVVVVNGNGVAETTVRLAGAPRQATYFDDQIWIADSVGGLITGGLESYVPGSPWSLTTADMTVGSGALWAAGTNVLSRLDADSWTNFRAPEFPVFDTVRDLAAVAFNAKDSSIWAGSTGQGLLQWRPGDIFTRYASGSITGAAFDVDGNGWFASGTQLLQRKPTGDWNAYPINGNAGQIVIDDNKQVWMILSGGGGVACYSPATNQWKYYLNGAGQGNLPDNNVYSLTKDRSGFIWIGTANGIGVVRCARSIFSATGCEAIWPVVQYDNFAGYLFSGQLVQSIAVDAADRKWIGTKNGVWLISSDAQKIIYHFTADSTPLLNNDVRKIVVDQRSGEVFFSTATGICSFRGTATEGGSENSNVLVFPNPVPPGYTGTIAIRGLVDGAIVKITELNGRLIYQTNALGGQAVWNGNDYRGRKVSTGIYLVLISDDKRKEQASTKIVFIGK